MIAFELTNMFSTASFMQSTFNVLINVPHMLPKGVTWVTGGQLERGEGNVVVTNNARRFGYR